MAKAISRSSEINEQIFGDHYKYEQVTGLTGDFTPPECVDGEADVTIDIKTSLATCVFGL